MDGEEELSVSETVFTNNSDSTDNNTNHGMIEDAAEIFHDFSTNDGDSDHASGAGAEAGTPRDMQTIIAQRERDLILAAELGKALLEENDELTKKQEHLVKEHADHIEALQQEKYELSRRLDITEGKYENKVIDLQSELEVIRKELTHQMATSRLADKDKQDTIVELMEQNQALTSQLAHASQTTDDLTSKLQHLQKQPARHQRRKTSTSAYDKKTIEELQDEVKLLGSKIRELERRIYCLTEEREALMCSLKESSDRLLMYEKHSLQMQQQLEARDGELVKARQIYNTTVEELEEYRLQATLSSSMNNNSLFFELGETHMSPRALSMEYEEAGEEGGGEQIIEDDDVFVETDKLLKREAGARGCADTLKDNKYKKVLEEVFHVLSEILWELHAFSKKPSSSSHNTHPRHRMRSNSGTMRTNSGTSSRRSSRRHSEDTSSPRPSSRTEEVRTQLKEVKVLLQGILSQPQTQHVESSKRKLSLDDHTHIYSLESHIESLRDELTGTQTHIELLQAELDNQDEQMRRKDEQLTKLHSKASELNVGSLQRKMRSLQDEMLSAEFSEEERERKPKEEQKSQIARVEPVRQEPSLTRPTGHDSPRNENVKRLQKERDDAIAKRNAAEMELTQARLDMMNLDGQLLEAINQKLELSQELDQWQVDIHELLDDRLRQQLRKQELERRKARAASGASNKTKLAALQKKFPFLNLKLSPHTPEK